MFLKGVLILATVFATDPFDADFSAQRNIFVSNADLNDYSHVFSDDESWSEPVAMEAHPTDLDPHNRRKYNVYAGRHLEIIKELAKGRTVDKRRKKSVNELFRVAEDLFKAENLLTMNKATFARYLNVDSIKSMKKHSRDSTSSTVSSYRKLYTAAHDAIVKEVVSRSKHEPNISKKGVFREVSERIKAQNLEPISRAACMYRFNKLVEKETKLLSELRP